MLQQICGYNLDSSIPQEFNGSLRHFVDGGFPIEENIDFVEDQPMVIPTKFVSNWPSSFGDED